MKEGVCQKMEGGAKSTIPTLISCIEMKMKTILFFYFGYSTF